MPQPTISFITPSGETFEYPIAPEMSFVVTKHKDDATEVCGTNPGASAEFKFTTTMSAEDFAEMLKSQNVPVEVKQA